MTDTGCLIKKIRKQRARLRTRRRRQFNIMLGLVLTILGAALSLYLIDNTEVSAGVTAPSILIISNDDTYSGSYTGGTSAVNMRDYLAAQGFSVTILSETANPGTVNAGYATTADTYDLVIFTQGIGYRSTNNNRPGLDASDIAFLKEYLNITNTVPGQSKAKLIIEGEDIIYDMGLSGTSTDQLNILKINTSSSRSDRGRISQLKVLDASHPVNAGLAASAPTSYQTSWQDSLVATTGALIVTNGTFGTTDYGTINTFDNGNGDRRVFMPFAWNANSSNLITNQTWRERLLLNAVKWVGETKVTVTASSLALQNVSPASTEEMLDVTLTSAWGTAGISGMKITVTGSHAGSPATAIQNVTVYNDQNNDGLIDGGDTLLGSTASFSGSVATVSFGTPFDLAAGETKNLIVAYQIQAGVSSGTIGARLADTGAVTLHTNDKLSIVYGSFPFDSVLSTITGAGTAEISSPAANTTIRGLYNVTGTTSGEYYLEYASGHDAAGPWTEINHGLSPVNNNTVGTWDTTVLNDGNYTLQLRVITGSSSTVNVVLDNTAPVLTSGPSVSTTTSTATITWSTDESSTSVLYYKKTTDGVFTELSSGAYVLNHSVQVSALESNTEYDYYVVSVDATGNTLTSVQDRFQTLQAGANAIISSPAVIGEVLPRIGATTDIIGTAKTDRNPDGNPVNWAVYYGAGASKESVSTWYLLNSSSTPVTGGVLNSWDTTGISNGTYVIKLVSSDPGISGPTATAEDYVEVIVDNTEPLISNVRVLDFSNVSADIAWDVNKQTTDEVVYGLAAGSLNNTAPDSDGDNRVFIGGLTRNTVYYYRVNATDNTGHTVYSSVYSFTTDDIDDLINPSVDGVNLMATGRTDTTVELAWNAGSDNSGISSYRVWRSLNGTDFTIAGNVSSLTRSFIDTGLNASTEYWYRLTALDLAGNESITPSNTVKVPTVAAFRVNPHGSYPKLTNMCVKCHHTHRGKKSMLFNDTQEQKVCFSCHNGSGSKYNIQFEYDPAQNWVSRHPLPMSHTQKECASCHNPHLSNAGTPQLLAAKKLDGTYVSQGPEFCLVCHGDEVVSKVAYQIGGSHQPFVGSVHDQQMALPPSGSRVTCEKCHKNHSSMDVRLTKAKEEENCYKCHWTGGEEAGDYTGQPWYGTVLTAVYDKFQKLSRHNITDADQADGSKIECVSCHNPHYGTDDQLGNRTIISDPYNTNDLWTPVLGNLSQFCLRCHDGDGGPTERVDFDYVVPYTVYFPGLDNISTSYYGGSNGGWNKSHFTDAGMMHYNNQVYCDKCHDSHGSDGKRLLARPEDGLAGTGATTGECASCHSASGEWRGSYGSAPDVYSQLTGTSKHPTLSVDGTNKHSDTENYANISTTDRHAECWDCHDPHLARQGGTKVGNLSGPLNNISGVTRSGSSLVWKNPATEDWEVCYKCHSNYWTNLGTAGKRNIAAEFYRTTANRSYHFVELTSNPNLTASNFTNRWTAGSTDHNGNPWTATSKMYCQDCHASPTGARGPHGSANPKILKGTWYTYSETTRASTADTLICFNCHLRTYYESSSSHDIGKSSQHNRPCWVCHGSRVHGVNRNHLVGVINTGVPSYDPNYENRSWLDSRTLGDPTKNSKNSCRSTNSACSDHK